MEFAVRIASVDAQVEPGSTAVVSVAVDNQGAGADRYEISVEGLDPEWVAIPVPTFEVAGASTGEQKFYIKPPRTSENLAGTYPFLVRVRSLKSGQESKAQSELSLKPYSHLSMDIHPRKGTLSPWRKRTNFQITVMNLGNAEHQLEFSAADNEDDLAYEFDSGEEVVGPGQQRVVNLDVTATRSPLLSSPRLHMFTATARSRHARSVGASAQAQVEQRAYVTPGTLAIVAVIAILATAWIAFWPKPPAIATFALSQTTVEQGQTFQAEWSASNATSVSLTYGDQTITGLKPMGSRSILAAEPGTQSVMVRAINGDRESRPVRKSITVTEPEKAPPPTIESISVEPAGPLPVDEPFFIRYELGPGVTEARLSPLSIDLDISDRAQRVIPDRTGKITYTIIARNKDGVVVEKSVTVEVIEVSDAAIVMFRAAPEKVDPFERRVTLSWQISGAVRAELRFDDQVLEVDTTGSQNLFIEEPTEFTLIAYDSEGRTVSQIVSVGIAEPSGTPPEREPPD